MSKENRVEGIVLKSIDHQDNARIITLFSKEQGILSLFVKGIFQKHPRKLALTTPFSEIEIVFKKGRSELFSFVDGSIIDEHFTLRSSYQALCAAGDLSKSLLQSQWPGKPSPFLYELFRAFLKQITLFDRPPSSPEVTPLALLVATFQLKLLAHEGLIAPSPHCLHCAQPACTLHQGESLCAAHRPAHAPILSQNLWDLLITLHGCKQFSQLATLPRDPLLIFYIQELLRQTFK